MRRAAAMATLVVATALAAAMADAARDKPVSYPDGYRGWTHVKSMVIEKGHALYDAFGGIHHVYANGKALEAMRKGGGTYPAGAVLVFDLLEADRKENAVVEGKRKVVGVMEKDPRRFASTGGWGFDAFAPGSRQGMVKDPGTECFECHTSREKADYVFSGYRD